MYLFPALIVCRETYMYSHREKIALSQNMSVPKIRHINHKSPNNVYNMSTISLHILYYFYGDAIYQANSVSNMV